MAASDDLEERLRELRSSLEALPSVSEPPKTTLRILGSAKSEQYLSQLASALDAHHETERRARELLEQADDRSVANGQNPMGAAAGALYLASRQTGEHLNQKMVADAADVSTVTVRERYQDLQSVAMP